MISPKGTMRIVKDPNIIRCIPYNKNIIVINLDEDDEYNLNNLKYVMGGTCLLPPMDAMIAEANGDANDYDIIYHNHLYEPFQLEYFSALLAYIYTKGDIIFYYPQDDIECTNTFIKFLEHIYTAYGIHIGYFYPKNRSELFFIDVRRYGFILDQLFMVGVINVYCYLFEKDINDIIPRQVIDKVVHDFNPYEDTYADAVEHIRNYRLLIHKKSNQNKLIVDPLKNLRGEYSIC